MSLPKIIKLSQTVWELWPAQDFGIIGDKYIMEKVRVHDMPTGPYLPNINKVFQTTYSRILLKIHSEEVTGKQPQQSLSHLHVTHLLVITNASTKHYENMSKGSKLWSAPDFGFRGDNYITKKKERVVCCT